LKKIPTDQTNWFSSCTRTSIVLLIHGLWLRPTPPPRAVRRPLPPARRRWTSRASQPPRLPSSPSASKLSTSPAAQPAPPPDVACREHSRESHTCLFLIKRASTTHRPDLAAGRRSPCQVKSKLDCPLFYFQDLISSSFLWRERERPDLNLAGAWSLDLAIPSWDKQKERWSRLG
jgi:hypothetical protein